MNRLKYYFYRNFSFFLRLFKRRELYTRYLVKAFQSQGIIFDGLPRYIHHNVYLDPLGRLELGGKVVISTNVVILTHDYSYNTGLAAINKSSDKDTCIRDKVVIGRYSFIGAGAIILPGTIIGDYCVIGAGSVVKGTIEPYSIIAGNPAQKKGDTRDWGNKFSERFSSSNKVFYSRR